jgi:hypothetical protein
MNIQTPQSNLRGRFEPGLGFPFPLSSLSKTAKYRFLLIPGTQGKWKSETVEMGNGKAV